MKIKLPAIAALAALLCASAGAIAAEKAPPSSDIESIEAKYRSIDDLSANFTQKTEIALLDRSVAKKGLLLYKKGGRLRIEYQGKDGKHYVSDGSTLWTYVPGDEASLMTFAVDDRNIPKEALSFLSGFGKLTREFKVEASEAFPDAPDGSVALHLVPRSKSPQYASLDALFGADRVMMRLVVKNESGNVSHYDFSNVKTNSGIPDSRFTLSSGKATPDTLPQ